MSGEITMFFSKVDDEMVTGGVDVLGVGSPVRALAGCDPAFLQIIECRGSNIWF